MLPLMLKETETKKTNKIQQQSLQNFAVFQDQFLHLRIVRQKQKFENDFSNFSFRRPGAQHRARWMSSCIYSLKMLLLQGQL